ncbi:Uncharacterised protein [Bergeriella denitrificans]|uniref:Uncharacterized protein n=2 Tax=Bergeriella denitrificans TaxID=494 RepID=A0A378UEY3_BERDE|nr:Uncharacterised protein [Bergeriella denitrificans]
MTLNQWVQGNANHEGLLENAQKIFDALHIPIRLDTLIDIPDSVGYCNYWVGSPKFWRAYMDFTEPFYRLIENDKANRFGMRSMVTHNNMPTYPLLPFFMERLPTLFLRLNPQFKYAAFNHYPDSLLRKAWGDTYPEMMACKAAKEQQDRAAFDTARNRLLEKLQRYEQTGKTKP